MFRLCLCVLLSAFLVTACYKPQSTCSCSVNEMKDPIRAESKRLYSIITQRMRRTSDSIYYVELPNEYDSRIRNLSFGSDDVYLCGYDYGLHETSKKFEVHEWARINSDCLIISKNGKTFHGLFGFNDLLKSARAGVRKNEMKNSGVENNRWINEKIMDTTFIGFEHDRSGDLFEYIVPSKYHWSDSSTIKYFNQRFGIDLNWGNITESSFGLDSVKICSERNIWSDSVNVCMYGDINLGNYLKSKAIKYVSCKLAEAMIVYYKG